MQQSRIAIFGGGPAGLMAAEALASAGYPVTVYEAMPTVARKFLLAGKSGLNITHSEDYAIFANRFGRASERLKSALDGFTPSDLLDWAKELGTETFVGSSGRVFPRVMKASPLLRAWLKRLDAQGVRILTRHKWAGFGDRGLLIESVEGVEEIMPRAAILALGGASWPRLGSDAAWVPWLRGKGVDITGFRPANCGFDVSWSDGFAKRFAGEPVKSVTLTSDAGTKQGEFVISGAGIEGSLVYAHSAALRDCLEQAGVAAVVADLAPGRSLDRLTQDLARQDSKASFSNRIRKATGLGGVKAALLREIVPDISTLPPENLAMQIKALAIKLVGPRPIAEAISSAGGVTWESIDETYGLKALPGVFVAGEMIDWEAPTGGYLLTACMATGRAAARGVEAWLSVG